MIDVNLEELNEWQYLYSYCGQIVDVEFYYKIIKEDYGYWLSLREEVSGSTLSSDSLYNDKSEIEERLNNLIKQLEKLAEVDYNIEIF